MTSTDTADPGALVWITCECGQEFGTPAGQGERECGVCAIVMYHPGDVVQFNGRRWTVVRHDANNRVVIYFHPVPNPTADSPVVSRVVAPGQLTLLRRAGGERYERGDVVQLGKGHQQWHVIRHNDDGTVTASADPSRQTVASGSTPQVRHLPEERLTLLRRAHTEGR
ncbi:hypothetical protein SAMN06265360_10656 [Haloechinothrix alba]|uniref:Uncharacterized protein n=1 Tax=Haloechinothrix alba TaxID=664784 RepID=A0A238WD56_9PSEU|nr:hypothetical protein [Haloechinothrix alba]SNR44516.1 hypothetical protein SAMN06265360_10656 [Haloechinothrix alba]